MMNNEYINDIYIQNFVPNWGNMILQSIPKIWEFLRIKNQLIQIINRKKN